MFLHNYMQYAGSSLLLLFVAAFLLFYQDNHIYQDNIHQAAYNLANYSDNQLAACQKLSATVGRSDRLLSLYSNKATDLDFSRLDSTTLFAAQHELVSAKALNRFAGTLCVYLYNKQYVISDYGTITLDSFYQSIFNMEPNIFSDYLRPLGLGKFLFLPQGAVAETGTPQHPLLVLSVVDGNGSRYGNLFVFLDERQMKEDVESLIQEHMEYYLFDANDCLVLSSRPVSTEELPSLLSSLKADSSYQGLTGSLSGWTGYAGYSAEYLFQSFLSRILLFTGIGLLLALLGLPFTDMICRKNYAPIAELAHIVNSPMDQEAQQEMEYESLKIAITSIFEDKSLLEEQILIYKPLLINSLLLELIEGTQPKETLLSGLQKLGVELPFTSCICISLLSECARQDFLTELALQLRDEHTVCLYVTLQKHFGTLLINAPDPAGCEAACKRLAALAEHTEALLFWGAGDVVEGLESLGSSYQQSRSALEYLAVPPGKKGLFWSRIKQSGVQSLTAPSCLKSLPASFGAGHFAEARDKLTLYFQSVICDGLVKKSHLLHAKEQMLLSLARAEKEQGLCCDSSPLKAWMPEQYDAFEGLKLLCREACDSLEQSMLEQREQQTQKSAQNLMNYLKLHLYDEDLSLSKIADEFGLSESSISRRIKQITDCNFLDYVSQKRIEYACRLLAETELSINDISKSAGYENDITFRRLFKKYMGITPGEYRRQQNGRDS